MRYYEQKFVTFGDKIAVWVLAKPERANVKQDPSNFDLLKNSSKIKCFTSFSGQLFACPISFFKTKINLR